MGWRKDYNMLLKGIIPPNAICIASLPPVEPKFSDWRVIPHEGGIYIIRDVLHASGKFSGQCQYAVRDDQEISWHSCVEGVLFADIQPFVRLTDG